MMRALSKRQHLMHPDVAQIAFPTGLLNDVEHGDGFPRPEGDDEIGAFGDVSEDIGGHTRGPHLGTLPSRRPQRPG